MILTLTINPAIDRNVIADRLVFEDRGYILATSESAGGRGINASRVIHSFGGETLAISTTGARTGKQFAEMLSGCGFPLELVKIKNEIRTNLTITDKEGLSVKLNERGPAIDQAELDRIEKTVNGKLAGAQWIMLCGSLPPGVPADFYSRLIRLAKKHGVKTLLDTDGDALRDGIETGPTAVAPNQQEAERLLSRALITGSHFHEAAQRIKAMGAESVMLSLGSRGAVGVEGAGLFEAAPPRVDAVCPIGAGDAMAAAFVWAMAGGHGFEDSVRWAVAAGTASAVLPGLEFASLEQTRRMYARVLVRRVL